MWDRVPVDVGVEDSRLLTEPRERRGEVRGQRRLADAALAARDREHARGGVERDALRPLGHPAAQLRGQGLPLLGAHDVERKRNAGHAGERTDGVAHLALEARAKRAAGDGERDRHGDVPALDAHVAHHVELGDGASELRVDHPLERGEHVLATRFHRSEGTA